VRYCLLSEVPTFEDGDFSKRVLIEKNNNELIANLGNLVNRTMVFIKNNFEGKVPEATLTAEDGEFLSGQKEVIGKVETAMDAGKIKDGLQHVMEFGKNSNRYFQDNKPWELVKDDIARGGTVLNVLSQQIKDLAILVEPFLPNTSESIFRQLGVAPKTWGDLGNVSLEAGHTLGVPEIIFRKIESEKKKPLEKPAEKKVSFADVDLEVGEVVSVELHPDAEKLYVEKVKLADGEVRQIVSGLVEHIAADELLGKHVVIVKNLAPAKLRGVESAGMLLVAEDAEGNVEVLEPEAEAGEKGCGRRA